MDLHEILNRGSSHGRNHLFQILCRSVEGFRICTWSNFAILHWLSRSPLTQGCATARQWYLLTSREHSQTNFQIFFISHYMTYVRCVGRDAKPYSFTHSLHLFNLCYFSQAGLSPYACKLMVTWCKWSFLNRFIHWWNDRLQGNSNNAKLNSLASRWDVILCFLPPSVSYFRLPCHIVYILALPVVFPLEPPWFCI